MAGREHSHGSLPLPSLLDEPAAPASSIEIDQEAVQSGGWRSALTRRWALAWSRRWVRRSGAAFLGCSVLGAAVAGGISLWPRSVPDYLNDPMDEVLDFTLLTEDFNRLPVERRLALIKDLVQRLKTMSASDSVLMASFATQLHERARQQLEINAKRLAVDTMDLYAQGYTSVPPEEREAYLDAKILEFTRMMEDISGEEGGLPEGDAERLATIKGQATRDAERARSRITAPDPRNVAQFLKVLTEDSDRVASPVQQARLARFSRDMTRHLRGQDLATGLPTRSD